MTGYLATTMRAGASKAGDLLARLCAILLLFGITAPLQAELYKWVDEEGNTHYSDQGPRGQDQSTVTTTMVPSQKNADKGTRPDPVFLPPGRKSRKIILSDAVYYWNQRDRNQQKIGVYYAGKLCTSRGAMRASDLRSHHPGLLPSESDIPLSMKRAIEKLGYDVHISLPQDVNARIRQYQGLYLEAVIAQLEVHSCAPVESSSAAMKPRSLSWRKFSRNRITLRVDWQVYSDLSASPVFATSTESHLDNWQTRESTYKTFNRALLAATRDLFASPEFIDLISFDAADSVLGQETQPQESEASPGWWESLIEGGNGAIDETLTGHLFMRSKVARVLAEANTVKIMSSHHFLQHDAWPTINQDLGLNDQLFENHELISRLKLHYDGTFTFFLREDVFGPSRILRMKPDAESFLDGSSLNLTWDCSSNLSRNLLPGNCVNM